MHITLGKCMERLLIYVAADWPTRKTPRPRAHAELPPEALHSPRNISDGLGTDKSVTEKSDVGIRTYQRRSYARVIAETIES